MKFSQLKYYLLFLLISWNTIAVFAQVRSKSESYSKRSVVDNDQIVQQKLLEANAYISTNPTKSIQLIEEALAIAIDNYDQQGQADAYYMLGKVNESLNEFGLAKINYLKAKDVYSILKDESGRYKVTKVLGVIYEKLADYDSALSFYQSFLALAKKAENKVDILFAQQSIARVLTNKGYYKEAESVAEEVLGAEGIPAQEQAKANIQMGKIKQAQQQDDEAASYFNRSQKIAEGANEIEVANEAFESEYSIYDASGNTQKKLELKEKALDYNIKNNNLKEQVENTIDIAEIYLKDDQPEEAINYLQQGVKLSDRSEDIEGKSRALEVLSKAYDEIGATDDALTTYKEYLSLEAIINQRKEEELNIKAERGRLLEKTQSQVEILEKDKELSEKTIELLKKEKKLNETEISRQQTFIYTLIIGLILAIVSFVLIMKNAREKQVANQLLMLKSLRSQMNPHFIFNALNSVNNFISKSDERSANKYLSDFSKLMRKVLDNSHQDFVPLSVELEILELYTKLEHFRFQDKFDYEFLVDDNIDIEAFMIPPMLIQPYIENAVWHGLRYKETKGTLKVNVLQQNEVLKIVVEDDGIGREKSIAIKTKNQQQTNSLGMRNIKDRLEIINKVYKLDIIVEITNSKQQNDLGTKVVVTIPQYIHAKSIA